MSLRIITKLLLWAIFLLGFMLSGCQAQQPIKIGFSGELTGLRGELGVMARDSILLAVEQINQAGGIDGRPIELLVKDDEGLPEKARQVDAELAEAGVVAIIGHITSQQTAAVFEENNNRQLVMLSPTASSTQFSEQDDYFFRIVQHNEFMGQMFAQHLDPANSDYKTLVGIYDAGNASFTEPLWESTVNTFTDLGGEVLAVYTYQTGQDDLQAIMADVADLNPDAVFMIASGVDTALLAQYGRQQGYQNKYFASTWAGTEELITKGGQVVDGMELMAIFNPDDTSPGYQEFVANFEARYQRRPELPASQAYEAMLILAEALRQTGGKAEGLADALKGIQDFPGIQGRISIDRYGDVQRDLYIVEVVNGEFKFVTVVSPHNASSP